MVARKPQLLLAEYGGVTRVSKKRETAGEEAYEVSGDRIRFDSTRVGGSKSKRVEHHPVVPCRLVAGKMALSPSE